MRANNFFRKVIRFFYPHGRDSKRKKKKSAEDTVKFWKEILRTNKIEFGEILFVYIVTAGDYTNHFFEETKRSIENKRTLNREFEKQFTWNKPHLHFELIITDKKEKYIGAVVYPYEYFDSPRLLWLFNLSEILDKSFLNEISYQQIYPAN